MSFEQKPTKVLQHIRLRESYIYDITKSYSKYLKKFMIKNGS